MLLPISHENATARRFPIVTAAIISICGLVMLLIATTERRAEEQAIAATEGAVRYFAAHPYLNPSPPLDRAAVGDSPRPTRLGRPMSASEAADARAALAEFEPPDGQGPRDEEERATEQAELDRSCALAREAIASVPMRRFGYVPASPRALTLVSSMFVHAGWLHLLFNMWFLWLAGACLEDRWGRPAFAGFYLLGGILATAAHSLFAPTSTHALVGASGAIAATMGAFLVLFARTRIKFLYLFFRIRGTFWAPAYVMLPLWLLEQLVYAWRASANDPVAYDVHVAGFVFGVVIAGGLVLTGFDRRLDAAVDDLGAVSVEDPRLARAAALIDAGKAAEAEPLLRALGAEKPGSIDVALMNLRAAKVLGGPMREGPAYGRVVRCYLEAGMVDQARQLDAEAGSVGVDAAMPAWIRGKLGDALVRAGDRTSAEAVYASLGARGVHEEEHGRALLAAAELARAAGRAGLAHERAMVVAQSAATAPADALRARELARVIEAGAVNQANGVGVDPGFELGV
jgi:membrane associated rhomboid family serine protease